ncbi:MAG TPA: hypothetical protein VEI07_01620 [Planctomycetaceae bacterium]|nr:hypothetical protein [Planctomycetaceae bacterium]
MDLSTLRHRCFAARFACASVFAILLIGFSASTAFAQLPQARLFSIFPHGGQAGTTFDLELTHSEDLDEADQLLFNHPGITAVPKTRDVAGHKEPVPNTFSVTIRPDVPSGVYELYAGGLFGLSNPRTFVVGSQPEIREVEPNNDLDHHNALPLGSIVNGTMNAETDVDVYRIVGKKGQRLLAFCRAADLDSKLAPVLELTDQEGRRLGYARQELRQDPLVDAVLPADATYFLKVHDLIYRGGPEFGYRLSAGSIPHIDYIMPPAGVAGSTAKYTLYGRNLPGGEPSNVRVDGHRLEKCEVEITLPASAPLAPAHTTLRSLDAGFGVVSYIVKTPFGESNPVLIALTRSAPILEREPNDTPETAQEMPAPGEFVGQFQAPGDTDYIKFHARAGQVFYIEVFAERLGSLADPFLVVERVERDAKGQESVTRMTAVDDENSNVAPAVFDTRTDDPSYRFQAPADGTYRIQLRDRTFESRGDPRLVYRLSIRPEEPDFRLVALPQYPKRGSVPAVSTWPLGLRKGDSRELSLLVIRKDGFRESIEVRADGLPPGVTCRGTALAANAKSGELIFTAAEDAPESSALIHIYGTAKVTDAKRTAARVEADRSVAKAADAAANAAVLRAFGEQAAKKANELLALNRQLADTDRKNPAFSKAVADAESAVASALKSVEVLKQAQAKAEAQLAEARKASEALAPRELVHEAIPGSIVWNAELAAPAVSRLGQSLALSVMKEAAPFQLSTEVPRLEVNQGRQILLPLKLARRNGFDGEVGMSVVGLSPGNLNIQNKAFPKGQSEELLRMFVARGTRAGTYAIYWNLQATVPYRRNVFALERAEREQAAAAKADAEAVAQAKTLAAARDQAAKKHAECEARIKPLRLGVSKLEEALAVAQRAASSTSEKSRAKSPAADEESPAQTAAQVAQFARKSAEEAEANAKSASPSARPELEARAAAARLLADELQKTADESAKKAAGQRDAVAVARRKQQESAPNLKQLAEQIDEARPKLVAAEAELKSAAISKQQAEALSNSALAKSKQLAEARKGAEASLSQAKQTAAPRNVVDFAPSTPIILTVKTAPIDVSASVPKGGQLKLGSRLDVKVTVRRSRGFRGPVTVMLPIPPGVAGIKAEPVTISAAKSDGLLTIVAEKSATRGAIANLVVRGAAEFEGQAEVDAPISIKVVP